MSENRWQLRSRPDFLIAIRNGFESRYGGSLHDLVAESSALTLLTAEGGEVNVRMTRALGNGEWEGEVLRAAQVADAPALGSIVFFRGEHIVAGTL
jgi:hypothetical protein